MLDPFPLILVLLVLLYTIQYFCFYASVIYFTISVLNSLNNYEYLKINKCINLQTTLVDVFERILFFSMYWNECWIQRTTCVQLTATSWVVMTTSDAPLIAFLPLDLFCISISYASPSPFLKKKTSNCLCF